MRSDACARRRSTASLVLCLPDIKPTRLRARAVKPMHQNGQPGVLLEYYQ
jgi:hypothetical protein